MIAFIKQLSNVTEVAQGPGVFIIYIKILKLQENNFC